MQTKRRISIDEAYRQYETSNKGLHTDEVNSRLKKYGPNQIAEKKQSPILKFLKYFWGPIPWMIEAAVILSAVVADWTDFGIILLLLITNAVVGFIEEFQADNAVEALKKSLAVKARALRDGNWKTLDASGLVPGDIIRVRLGDVVPADALIIDGENIQADQSALTGESLPVKKEKSDEIFSGSIIKQGEATALITATGIHTFFGKTTSLMEDAHTTSHFQKAVLKIGNYLIIIALVLVATILAVSIFRGDEFLTILRFCLVLTIAAIPVAMPTVLSVTMVVGAKLLSKKQAVVRKLSSIEEMAGVDVLCSDKTGTLTKNKLEVGEIIRLNGHPGDEILCYAKLASRAENDDPIDTAVLNANAGTSAQKHFQTLNFKPFDPVIKRTEAKVKDDRGHTFLVSKGAPQVILDLCKPDEKTSAHVKDEIDELAGRGYRSLGVAVADDEKHWQYLGLLPLLDPPREDSKEVIDQAKKMGITVKMVTGDQEAIARETASKLGIGNNVLNAGLFKDTKHHEAGRMEDRIEEANVFAEVYPEHKYHIVDVLQKKNHIVGMTGDGVNDAPALKKADAGIAVSGATDAARAASAMVLLTPGLSVIIDAIKESRKIFQRMNSYTIYRITETIRVLFFMTLSILTFNFYPVTAVMIVLLALLNDGAIISIAYDRAKSSMHPEAWKMPLVFTLSTVLGVIGVIESFGLLYIGKQYLGMSQEILQTLIYLKLSVAGHLTIFVTRTRKNFWTDRPSNTLLFAVIITQAIATLIAVYGLFMTPLGWKLAGIVWAYCIAWFLVEDAAKVMIYKMVESHNPLAKVINTK
ncbi:MAG: plasma-membrane proton-efflux P-type ATPase [Bacteroidales bacterium]|nr:plasma-membrane proton-efflux P-type ATPase [Bacteroidales bacterium]